MSTCNMSFNSFTLYIYVSPNPSGNHSYMPILLVNGRVTSVTDGDGLYFPDARKYNPLL